MTFALFDAGHVINACLEATKADNARLLQQKAEAGTEEKLYLVGQPTRDLEVRNHRRSLIAALATAAEAAASGDTAQVGLNVDDYLLLASHLSP